MVYAAAMRPAGWAFRRLEQLTALLFLQQHLYVVPFDQAKGNLPSSS